MAQLQSQQHTNIVHTWEGQVYTVSLPMDIGDGDDQLPLAVAQRLVTIGLGEYQIVGEIESDSGGGNGDTGDTSPPIGGVTVPTGAEAVDPAQMSNDPPTNDAPDDGNESEGGEPEIPTPGTRTRAKGRKA